MRTLSAVLTASLLAGTVFAGPATGPRKKDPWKYAGEDRGVRFYFQPDKRGGIRIKVENILDTRVDVLYRVRDTDWKKSFSCSLAPGAADSTIRYRPLAARVLYPFFDRIFLERTEDAAASEPAPLPELSPVAEDWLAPTSAPSIQPRASR
jgi:hypothetical protein